MKSEKKIQINVNEQLNNYKIDIVIGRGSYSIVKLASCNNKKYAVKIYCKNKVNTPDRKNNLQREITIMKDVNHQNIIRFKEQIQTEDQVYLFMELFDNCSLSDYLKKKNVSCGKVDRKMGENYRDDKNHNTILTKKNQTKKVNERSKNKINEPIAKYIFKQIIDSIFYLHTVKNIVHRDLKLDNILIEATEMKVKIIDFGFSCYDQGNVWHEDYCGTPNYMSPEIYKKEGYQGKPADIWALGILLYYLIIGSYPFKSPSENNDYTKIKEKAEQQMSKELRNLMQKMLQNNPKNRFTIEQIRDSEWLKEQ